MTYTWFKLHHDLPGDIKIRMFTPQEKWAWVALLCLASQGKDRGEIAADNDDIAGYCEFNCTQDWLYFRDKLISKGMIEFSGTGALKIVHWNDRQYGKPSDRPEAIRKRVSNHRKRKKTDSETPCNALHPSSNADVTPQIRLDTDQIRLDTDQITELEEEFVPVVSQTGTGDLKVTGSESTVPVGRSNRRGETKYRPENHPDEFAESFKEYCALCDEHGADAGCPKAAAAAWDKMIKSGSTVDEIAGSGLRAFIAACAYKAQKGGGKCGGIPHFVRYIRGSKDHPTPYWRTALDWQDRMRDRKDISGSQDFSRPEWLTNPDDRFIAWLRDTHLPQRPEYRGVVISTGTTRSWLTDAKHKSQRFEQAEIAWETFTGIGDIESVQRAINVELKRLDMGGFLPDEWVERTGATTTGKLGLEDAIAYLDYLKSLNHVTTA